MANSNGKKARKTGGNRYACKRRHRHARIDAEKVARWQQMEKERTRHEGKQ